MRKAKPKKRVILPDPVFGEVMVAKFVILLTACSILLWSW